MGCYAAAGVYGEFDEQSFRNLLRLGHERGVTLYDTADTYGDGERILGEAVRPFRGEVVVATKVGLTPEGGRDCSPDHIIRSCEESLNRLDTDYIDLYQVHYHDPQALVSDTVGALERLKKQGKIREYGVGHLPGDRVREYLELGSPAACLAELNCVTRGAYRQLLSVVSGSSVGIIGFSPSGRGLLSGTASEDALFSGGDVRSMDPLYRGGKFRSALRVTDELRSLADRIGATPVQVAIRWAIELPGVKAVLIGTTSRQHLLENLGSVQIPWDVQIQDHLDTFLDEEDARFQAELPGELKAVLQDEGPVSADTLWDVLYVMEQAIECRWVGEEDILPFFTRLWAMRSAGVDEEEINGIRASLWDLLFQS